jgi:hypothetical protein
MRSQRATNPFRLVASSIALACALTVLAGACGRGGAPSPDAMPSADTLLKAVANATESLRTVHFTLSHQEGRTSMGGLLMMDTADGDVQFPDNVKAAFAGSVPAFNVAVRIQMLQIGKDAVISDPFGGQWRAVDAASLPFHFTDLDKTLARAFRALERPTASVGQPEGGAPTYRIAGAIPTDVLVALLPSAVTGKRAQVELVVGQQDKLPRLIRIQGPLLADDIPTVVRILRLSSFDKPVSVELPPKP